MNNPITDKEARNIADSSERDKRQRRREGS